MFVVTDYHSGGMSCLYFLLFSLFYSILFYFTVTVNQIIPLPAEFSSMDTLVMI